MLKENNEKIITLLKSGNIEQLRELSEHIHPVDILEAIEDREDAHILLNKLPSDLIAEVIEEAEEEDKYSLLDRFTPNKQKSILNKMASDEVTDLLNHLESQQQSILLGRLNKENREDVESLLRYDSETAGGIMTTEFLAIYEHKTIVETLAYLRKEVDAETTYYLYVIDRKKHLKGVVSLRDIIMHDFDIKIADILNPNVISIPYYEDQEQVAYQFEKYGFLLMPVVDDEERLIGVITVDDILDVIIDETTEDIHHLAGINKEEKVDGTLSESIKSRLPWLCVNLITALLASFVIGMFQDTIAQIVALSAVMTIISGMGGNAGTQALTIVVRGLSLKEITKENAISILCKEMGVGLFTGTIVGVFVAFIAMVYNNNPMFGLIAALAMLLNMVCATFAGFSVPLILEKMKIDPALASGVFVTTVTDICGFLFFLGFATLAMPYL